MVINKITLTGADEDVSYDYMQDLYKRFPMIEFGILLSENSGSKPRYPSTQWIENLPDNLPLSLHICGFDFPDYKENTSKKFKRIQINNDFSVANEDDIKSFLNIINNYSQHKFIFQYNENNKKFLESLSEKTKDFHILYDSSLGRGSFIGEILPPPFHDIYTGYAGGINPDNILDIVKQIIKIDVGVAVYLDVESGIRTDNKWDHDKVEKILKYV